MLKPFPERLSTTPNAQILDVRTAAGHQIILINNKYWLGNN
jgi:hypothetical protein